MLARDRSRKKARKSMADFNYHCPVYVIPTG